MRQPRQVTAFGSGLVLSTTTRPQSLLTSRGGVGKQQPPLGQRGTLHQVRCRGRLSKLLGKHRRRPWQRTGLGSLLLRGNGFQWRVAFLAATLASQLSLEKGLAPSVLASELQTREAGQVAVASTAHSPVRLITEQVPAQRLTEPGASALLPEPLDSDGRARVIVDLAHALSASEYEQLRTRIHRIEDSSGYRVRILTQRFETVGRTIAEYFGLADQRSILVVLDERIGNVLNFRVGEAVTERFPTSFWLELQGRYGNQFYVRDNGEYRVLDACISALETCLESDRVCRFVPGFGRDQWALSFLMSLLGGAVIGFTARTPQQGREAETPNWRWILVFSPLWAVFLVSFGTLPIVAREGWWSRDLAANWAGALLVATAFWYAIPRVFPGGPGDQSSNPP